MGGNTSLYYVYRFLNNYFKNIKLPLSFFKNLTLPYYTTMGYSFY